jgi:hypothetical protein
VGHGAREPGGDAAQGDMPGCVVLVAELREEGFLPLTLEVRKLDAEYPFSRGCEWTTVGDVPKGPGVYAFTVGDDHNLHVTYVGLTEELWMVTKGRLPSGGARPGQRYGRPLYAGVTRQRINALVAEQLVLGRLVRHWVSPRVGPSSDRAELRGQLVSREERLIQRWDLRRVGWNRG